MLVLALSLLLTGCTGSPTVAPGDPQRYAEALAALQADPTAAQTTCSQIQDPALRGDCLCAGAEALAAAGDADGAAVLCALTPAGLAQDECWFMVAERSAQPALCGRAGRFGDDCRLHLLQQAVAQSPDPLLAGPELLQRAGFADDDPRPWTLLYRHALGQQQTLDLALCEQAAGGEEARLWCRRAGVGLLHDRLNYVRDARVSGKTAWCAGEGPPPAILRHAEDPELEAAITAREDVCGR